MWSNRALKVGPGGVLSCVIYGTRRGATELALRIDVQGVCYLVPSTVVVRTSITLRSARVPGTSYVAPVDILHQHHETK